MTPDLKKIAKAARKKSKSLKPHASLTKYLNAHGIRRIGITKLTKMINEGELTGKTVVQTDYALSEPAKNLEQLEGLDAADIVFLVMDRETAEKILVLGLP